MKTIRMLTQLRRTIRFACNASVFFCLLAVSVTQMLTPATAIAAGLDAIAADRAAALAAKIPWVKARGHSDSLHPLGVQTLSVEKKESKNAADTTLLWVYQFHYDLRQSRLLTLNPSTETITKTQTIDSVHLPLNTAEIAYAISMLEAQSTIIDQLRDEQSSRGQAAFTSLAELDVKASIYEPLQQEHTCRQQRCALLSLFDNTNTVFSTEPVVNLQSQQVGLLVTR
jgi:hypothetical protein